MAWPELRLVAALLLAAAAVGLAIVLGLARWTDLLLLDLSRLTPSTTVPALEGAALDAAFDAMQTPVAEQRPFRVTLRLPATARAGDVMAAEGSVARRGGRSCLSVLAFADAVLPSDAAPTLATRARVWVDDELRAAFPLTRSEQRETVWIEPVRPRARSVRLRFEVLGEPPTPGEPHLAKGVHFELARLRRCGP